MNYISSLSPFLFKMLPELLYEIYKYIAPKEYLKLNAITILKHLVDTFKDPLEGKYIYFNGEPIKGLNHGLKYIALTNPTYRWVYWPGFYSSLIQYASLHGYLEVVKLLLAGKRVDPSVGHSKPITCASIGGHLEVVKLLLEDKRVDPSNYNNSAIRYASYYGRLEVVKLLLEDERVDPSDDNNCAIGWASNNGHLEVVKLLLEDERVRQSLTNTQIKYYLKRISYKNELNYHLITISIQKCYPNYCTKSTNI